MGTKTTSRTGEGGFTLLEILLALAVIGLIAAALIGGSARLLTTKPLTPDQVFWDAVQRARKAALTADIDVRLSFDSKAKQFVVDDGTAVKNVPIVGAPDIEADFLPADTGSSTLFPGASDLQTMPGVTFYGDGTCTPFRMQFRTAVGNRQIRIDPWTCAPMLNPLNPDGTPAAAR